VPIESNEREAFTNLTWSFVRGALTMPKIESRSLEVLITGVSQRKNQNKDLLQGNKEIGQYADGITFFGESQVYLAEASAIHQPKAEKLQQDEYKMAPSVTILSPFAPVEKDRKMKRAMLSCLHLAARVEKELLTREIDLVKVSYEESVQLLEAARKIDPTNSTPKKGRRK
ncbi:hypothetical protein BG011_001470, partial [Mortierella polycephala]